MTGNGQERRRAPRIPYEGEAVVFVGNDRHECRIVDLSKVGALIAPPLELKVGAYLRLNIKLPQLDQLIDVDAVVARETTYEGTYACGLAFMNVSKQADTLMEAFINRALQWQEEKSVLEVLAAGGAEQPEAAPAASTEPAEEGAARPQKGGGGAARRKPAIARILQSQQTRKMSKEPDQPAEPKKPKGRDPMDRFMKEVDLRQIYRDAMDGMDNGRKKKDDEK